MARNVEIKARVPDPAALRRRVAELADRGPVELEQHDSFFATGDRSRRLKLRRFADDRPAELIAYLRPDRTDPSCSDYRRVELGDGDELLEALRFALASRGEVRKQRTVYWVGRTRVHLDRVDGLGDFVELEVVLDPSETEAAGEEEAARLMEALEIREEDLVEVAYRDLLVGD